jgi:solute carrier family 40 (iron-regulated transporter), member 1
MWAFAAPLIFVSLFSNSLFPATMFAFTSALSCFLAGPYIGSWVDRTARLTAVRVSLLVQNVCVVIASVLLYFHFPYASDTSVPRDGLFVALFTLLNVVGSVAEMASVASSVAVEKDWVVVVAGGDSDQLAKLNAIMKRIDLTCNVVAPLAFGILLDLTNTLVALILAGAWNAVSLVPEYILLKKIYDQVPELAVKSGDAAAARRRREHTIRTESELDSLASTIVEEQADLQISEEGEAHNEEEEEDDNDEERKLDNEDDNDDDEDEIIVNLEERDGHEAVEVAKLQSKNPLAVLFHGWTRYCRHKVTLASVCYVLLYITVLSGGVQAIAYLKSVGVAATWIALFQAGTSVMGIASTFVVVPAMRRMGNLRAGQFFLTLQLASLLPGVAAFFYLERESTVRVVLFLSAIIASRVGLWGFDLVEVQIMQLFIDERERGLINATESALTNLAWLFMLGLGLALPDPAQFGWLVAMSFSAVAVANIVYIVWWQHIMQRLNHYAAAVVVELEPEESNTAIDD